MQRHILCELKITTEKKLSGLIIAAIDSIEAGFNDPNISARDRFIMGIKFLELCGKHNIELKTKDMSDDEDVKKVRELTFEILAQREEARKRGELPERYSTFWS